MPIRNHDRLPAGCFKALGPSGIVDVTSDTLFAGRKVALFGLPGAFTPVCSASHLPGYVDRHDEFKAAGFDEIVCVSVNDPFVMEAWSRQHGAAGKVTMLCDTDASFTKAMGLVADLAAFGLHDRSERYSMIVEDGVVKKLSVEKTVFDHDGTSALCMLRG